MLLDPVITGKTSDIRLLGKSVGGMTRALEQSAALVHAENGLSVWGKSGL